MSRMSFDSFPLTQLSISRARVEFHVSRASRDKYGLSDTLFSKKGHIVSADFPTAQHLAERINESRKAKIYPERRVSGAEIYALALIHEIFHHIIHLYISTSDAGLFDELHEELRGDLGEEEVANTLREFVEYFPPTSVYRNETGVEEFLSGEIEGTAAKELTQEELILLWIFNRNPAVERYRELFDESRLEERSAYKELMASTYLYFQRKPGFGSGGHNLLEFLRAPAHTVPDDLMGQLEYIRDYWGDYIGEWAQKILTGIDLLHEETRPRFGAGGPGPAYELSYGGLQEEYEKYSEDTHWMPRVVLIAKSTFVWLDQLSKRYHRPINRLDEIPEEELDRLADMGFTSLWLIGLWERSSASKTIKRSCGNPEAEASAYSLKRYEIAEELGGWAAMSKLRERAWRRGIRMAGDMVPNHTAIDSDWVYEHPEWYLQLPEAPYPSYSYNSQNLSEHPGVGIYLEDHYYDRTDAALTFKRVDFESGDTRYIYHGNDGTSMPWNDTAQLDYLNPDTREIVIQTIIHVAKNFPIIRFDAAMTLAKRHIHRLWYPAPGHGGDIPGRAIHGLTEEEFNARMPAEFWREVVDRVAEEAPDTLLLAEAFWMMEGYFVRTLGMHRVYNSAFMNMLKKEDNEKYKNTVKNTVSFDPEILKRFVNFMNNPDEDTAIEQFGAGDKYLGVATLLVTMPGLPMFGHGQIEGFREKYGMEYRRAYWNEVPNQQLVDDHYRYIFPLMKRRPLFSQVENFRLYDFYRDNDEVDHNIFAYSNSAGSDRALVLYHNAYASASGRIQFSAPHSQKNGDGSKNIIEESIAEALGLGEGPDRFLILREQRSGLQFIEETDSIRREGLYISLGAYESKVFLDLYEVYDESGLYRRLYEELGGRGVYDLERERKLLYLRPAHRAFAKLLDTEVLNWIDTLFYGDGGSRAQAISHTSSRASTKAENAQRQNGTRPTKKRIQELAALYSDFIDKTIELGYISSEGKANAVELFKSRLKDAPHLREKNDYFIERGVEFMPEAAPVLYAWILLDPLIHLLEQENGYHSSAALAEELLLPELFYTSLRNCGVEEENLSSISTLILALADVGPMLEEHFDSGKKKHDGKKIDGETDSPLILEEVIRTPSVSQHLEINKHLDIEWFKGESFQELLWWMHVLTKIVTDLQGFPYMSRWLQAEEKADYHLATLEEKV